MNETVLKNKEEVPFRGIVKRLYKIMGKAIADYNMLSEGDRILIGVSGGVDSLSLLKLFCMRQKRIPINFEIIACFVDTSFVELDRPALFEYLDSCGINYTVKKLELNNEGVGCFWCSWMRRRILFETAREHNCNKVSLGHNIDDMTETILMNMCFRGEVSVSPPALEMFGGKLKIIRPLCYIEKKEILDFASRFSFPDTHYECPYGKQSRRNLVKGMLEGLEKECPYVKKNIFRSLKRIKKGYLL
jgi:tRNA 2-thiocytidine biosynthesis protein TtcA